MRSIRFKALASILFGLATVNGVAASKKASKAPKHEVREYYLSAEKSEMAFPGPDGANQEVYAYNLTYDGMTSGPTIPGPLIWGNLGDILKVHFTNNLDEETTVHWHGKEVPAVMDGSPISQFAVRPGECFIYEFELIRASTYWYHPHIESDKFVEKGLYGPFVVRDPTKDYFLPNKPSTEFIAMLDDVRLDEGTGLISPHLSQQASARVRAEMLLNGRIGTEGGNLTKPIRLVNGDKVPVHTLKHRIFELQEGEPIRIRFINVANTLFFRLSFPCQEVWRIASDGGLFDEPVKIEAIGTDSNGISNPDLTKGLLITPGERVEVVSAPRYDSTCDGKFVVEWHDMPIGLHGVSIDESTGDISANHNNPFDGKRPKEVLISQPVAKNMNSPPYYTPPSGLVKIDRIYPPEDCLIVFTFAHIRARRDGYVPFFGQKDANGNRLSFDQVTSKDAPTVERYEKCYIDVENTDGHDHNFHLHGFHFLLDQTRVHYDNGTVTTTRNEHLEWLDTIHSPRRPGGGTSKTVLRLAVQFGNKNQDRDVRASGKCPTGKTSGGWLAHCHMLEHGDYGMASFVQVVKKKKKKSMKIKSEKSSMTRDDHPLSMKSEKKPSMKEGGSW